MAHPASAPAPTGPESGIRKKLREVSPRVTVTFRLPRLLNHNLKAYCVQTGKSQNEVAVRLLADFLQHEGIQLDTPPRFFAPRRRGASV